MPNGDPRDGFFYLLSHSWWILILCCKFSNNILKRVNSKCVDQTGQYKSSLHILYQHARKAGVFATKPFTFDVDNIQIKYKSII